MKEGQPIPDSRPPDAGGASPADVSEQQALITAVTAKVKELNAAIADAQAQVDKESSIMTAVLKVVDLVEAVLPSFQRVSTTTSISNASGIKQSLLSSVASVLLAPADQRTAVATAAAQSLLKGFL